MSQKTIIIFLVIFVALVGAYFLQKSLTQPAKDIKSFTELKVKFEPESVKYIQVFKEDYPDSGLFFARKDTSWVVVNDYSAEARSKDVEQLLTDLYTVGGSLRGETEDLFPDFSITDKNALQIKLMGPDSSLLAHVFVGKGGPDGKTCFMRLPGSPKVYLADNNFISRFSAWGATPEKKLPTDRWMNLNFVKIGREEIASFKLHTPKTDYEFTSTSQSGADSTAPPTKKWQQVAPQKGTILDESKIANLQSTISGLNALGVTDPANAIKHGLEKPAYSVWVGDESGKSQLINFSDKIDTLDNRYITVSGSSTVFKVNKGVFNRVFTYPFEDQQKAATTKPKANKKT